MIRRNLVIEMDITMARLCRPYIALLFLLLMTGCATTNIKPAQVNSAPPVYDYPIQNPYAATVIGVPPEMQVDYSSVPRPTDKTLTLFRDRPIPDGFWYERGGLKYRELLQSKPAALVYVIAGTGADSRSVIMQTLANMLYSAGYSVVLLPSPTHPNFIVNASSNFVPGRPTQDAEDIYRVINQIDPQVQAEAKVTNRMLMGYSLGAVDALFTARLADEQKSLTFSKVLLINPPLNLYSSIQIIDSLLYRDMPHGVSDANYFIQGTIQRLSSLNQSTDALDFSNEHLLLDAYVKNKIGDNRLATMVGISFRISAADMIFTADVMGHDGYIFPQNREFTTTTPLNDYMALALRTSFKNYFDQIYSQKYLAANPGLTSQDLIREGNIETLADYIAQHKNIGVVTNADDIILAPGEYDKLVRLFGNNAIVFPIGGHMGNIAHPAVAYRIVTFLGQ